MSTTSATSTINKSRTLGYKPKQNIPRSQKTQQWAIDNVDWCISMLPFWFKRKVDRNWDLYNGKRTQSDYEYITKTYGIEMPAGKLDHIPLIRPMLNELVSEYEERDFPFSVIAEDPDSVAEKVNEISGRLIYDIAFTIRNARSSEELDMLLDNLQRQYEKFQTETEINAMKLLRNYIQRHRLDRQFSETWLDKLVTGLQYCHVRLNRKGEDPIFDIVKAGDIFHADDKVRWVSQCSWAVRVSEMSPTQIIDTFGDRMSDKDIRKIEDWLDMYHKDAFYKLGPGQSMDNLLNENTSYYNNQNSNHKITVYFVEWKSIEEVNFLKSPNKYDPEDPFLKFIPTEQLYQLPSSRKKLIEKRYIETLWHGIRIGDEIYVDLGEDTNAVRSMANPSKVYLNFEGPAFNSKYLPYSLIEDTSDLQDLYDILHWHKKNLIALSGVRGSFMDISQLPDFFDGQGQQADNIKMWFYYRKLGAAFIDRSQSGADRSFNQFPNYDDTLGAGLQAILTMIQHIEDVAARITGVNRQRMGQIKQYDGKQVTENAQLTSSLITEFLFNAQDEFVERSLTLVLNKLRISYPNGLEGSFTTREGRNEIFRLDSRFFLSDWGVYVTTRKSDARKIEELKAHSYEMVKGGMMSAENLFIFFKKDSFPAILNEIEEAVIRRKQEIMTMQQQQQSILEQIESARAQSEIQKLQAEAAELQAKIENYTQQVRLDEQALQIEREANLGKLENDKARVELEAKQLDLAVNTKGNAAEVRDN
jgi:hypothetical protein